MGALLTRLTGKIRAWYQNVSIQLVLSLSFTAVAVVGMLILGVSLSVRFANTADDLMQESSQRVLDQVNWNLDSYLRSIMRISDTLYYRVVKDADPTKASVAQGMELLYEENRDSVVSIAVFDRQGGLVAAAPAATLKGSAFPSQHDWFRMAMEKMENFHFSGSIKGYREGEMFFPNSPILQVEGTFGECTLLETLLLSILNYDSAVASAASRMVSAAKDRPCMDMGGRRTNEWAAVAAARAAVVGGFKGTANLLAAQMYGLKAIGTAAHCFTLVHDNERSAFESQIAALGKNTTLLVDTYNIEEAVKTAVDVAGPELGGVRIDSGDLASLAQRVRNQLDALGATNTKITVTNDLDEYALAALQTAPVDSYGVGTMLVTGSGAPTCAMVYKLTERENSAGEMQPVAKKSKDKATVPGRKLAFRSYEYSLADCEHVISGSEDKLAAYQPEDGWKDLLVDYVTNGENHRDDQENQLLHGTLSFSM